MLPIQRRRNFRSLETFGPSSGGIRSGWCPDETAVAAGDFRGLHGNGHLGPLMLGPPVIGLFPQQSHKRNEESERDEREALRRKATPTCSQAVTPLATLATPGTQTTLQKQLDAIYHHGRIRVHLHDAAQALTAARACLVLDLVVDVPEPSTPVGVLNALKGLGVGLQAETVLPRQPAHGRS